RISSITETFEYNEYGKLKLHHWTEDEDLRTDQYIYYPDSDPVQKGYLKQMIVDASQYMLTTTYEYDAAGNVTRVIDPMTHDSQFVYNALNQVVRSFSRPVTTPAGDVRYRRDYFYDADNNVWKIETQ